MEIKPYLIEDGKSLLNYLARVGGKSGQTMARRELRWNEYRFRQTVDYLRSTGAILLGKGKGGSILLPGKSPGKDGTVPSNNPSSDVNGNISADQAEYPVDEDKDELTILSTGTWQYLAAERINDLLTEDQLEKLSKNSDFLKELKQIIRNERHLRYGVNAPPSKKRVIFKLMEIFDSDFLIANHMIPFRNQIAETLKLRAPSKFHPGKESAINFVRSCGLPAELAGVAYRDHRVGYEDIEGVCDLPPLADYQSEVAHGINRFLNSHEKSAMVSLPTGGGKTRTAVEAIHRWVHEVNGELSGDRNLVIWLAQTDELCEQAFEEFEEFWKSKNNSKRTRFVRLWGQFWKGHQSEICSSIKDDHYRVVLVSTPQTLNNILGQDESVNHPLRDAVLEEADLLVVDEAHHAAASSYLEIKSKLIDNAESGECKLLGLTATPFRNKKTAEEAVAALQDVFGTKLIFPRETLALRGYDQDSDGLKIYLQEQGVLAKPKFNIIETNFTYNVSEASQKAIANEFEKSRFRHKRRELIRSKLLELLNQSPSARVLYFDVSVLEAMNMSSILTLNRINSAVISGESTDSRRFETVKDFRNGKISVLCNCELLTTGFDAPKITHVVIARPISSPVLYAQMIGRGLRGTKFGGTDICEVIEFRDNLTVDGQSFQFVDRDYFDEWDLTSSLTKTIAKSA